MKNSISLGFVLLLVGGAGCKKSMGADMSHAPSAGYDDYGGEEEMDMDHSGDREFEAPAAESATVASEPRRAFGRRARQRVAKETMASPPAEPPAPPVIDGNATQDSANPVPADERPPEVDDARHIIYTAGMRVAVFNLSDAMDTAEALPDRFGGYVQSMSENTIVLRLPSKSLRKVMTALDGYGNVEQRWMRSQDVTAEFTDVESRIRALQETQTQLLRLLDKARTVEEALKVRQALDGITSELEVLKGRMRQLDNMTTYSTLTLEFYERGPHNPTPSSNDPFPWVDSLGVEDTEWK